jgi:hypothetical protein
MQNVSSSSEDDDDDLFIRRRLPARKRRDVAPAPPSVDPEPKNKQSKWISSFGRRKDRLGAIGFGGVAHNGYRYGMAIQKGLQLQVHTLVNVYFNDPDLVKWKAEKAKCRNGERVTTDHGVLGEEYRSENYWWRLDWATKEKQTANREVSDEAKASCRAKKSHGMVQAREWHGRVKGVRHRSWTGGTPDAWDDALKWMGTYQAAAHTGHDSGTIRAWKWLGDGKAHRCEKTGKDWEYRLIEHVVEPGYESENWFDLGNVDALGDGGLRGVLISDMGRIDDGTGTPPSHGTKVGAYRSKCIDGKLYQMHELMGWAFFGPRPSPEHTIDHIDKTTLDNDGCLSNALSNLSATWADKSTQSKTRRNGSRVATSGKRVRVRVKATGAVTEYTDTYSASRALGASPGFVSGVCRKVHTSTKFEASYIEEEEHLVRVRAILGPGCKLSLVTEVERWAEIDPADWEEGGKYFCVRGVKPVRSDASTHVPSARNKRKRGAK